MYGNNKKEGNQENISHYITHNITNIDQGFGQIQEPSLIQEMQQQNTSDAAYIGVGGNVGGGSTLTFPEVSQILPWTLPPVHSFNPVFSTRDHDPFLLPPPPPPPLPPTSSSYGGFFNRMASGLQFGYDGPGSDHQMRLISESLCQMVSPNSAPFGLHAELQKMTAQEIMDAKALAASKSHSEAERRRRERINNHLAKLRSLLPSTTKTDKASLLAEVIQQVKELKRQTSLIAETSPVPTETDELIVDNASEEDGKLLIKASICCEDRSDLLPDLIKTLKTLRLKTLKAEITTLGGRVKNVLFITGDDVQEEDPNITDNEDQNQQYSISSIQEALKAVMEKSNGQPPRVAVLPPTSTAIASMNLGRRTLMY
ncbi:transcription factor bHLH30-like isoform X2 [Henckelia pumila]|uniref:transcription factor bHLH30-like isoform X2 n=1 Tax=Henckelia pumila TaxID=405737 RepID=UPI003C6DE5EC